MAELLSLVNGSHASLYGHHHCLSIRTQRQIRTVRLTVRPEDEPNPTRVKQFFKDWNIPHADNLKSVSKTVWVGKRWTSRWRLLGLPLVDIQFSDIGRTSSPSTRRHAMGWIAFGDQATGILLAIGGLAQGGIAIGGLAIGAVALGGLSMGGLAVGDWGSAGSESED